MSFLGALLGAPNSEAVLASSSTSSAGGQVLISAPALVRKKSGYFNLSATVSATTPGAGTQGILLQLVSSLTGNVGPAVPYYGTSASGSVEWVDITTILVGQPVQYSVRVTPISPSNSISIAAGAAALTIDELGGPTPNQ